MKLKYRIWLFSLEKTTLPETLTRSSPCESKEATARNDVKKYSAKPTRLNTADIVVHNPIKSHCHATPTTVSSSMECIVTLEYAG